MSTTIDERVVEMRFDNKQFESNVSTTMSTLDKLKQKLNFTGASKGLENINSAAKNINMSGLGNAVETVRAKFSALEVMGVTALANITNSAVNAGKRIVSALTIDPIKTGFQEYETQINAVQTILANTQSKGTTLDDVNSALDTLNAYADKTIYNFTEMTRNIGTFTAAGVDLDKSVTSIKGIANLAAMSGSTSQQASTAMYQLSQALAAGKVQLMDWNSVVNAGMGGEVFQNALKRTATQMGYNVDALIEKYGSFRESLTRGEWLTAEVLTETLTQLSGAYTKADLIAQGYTEKQAQEILQLAETAENAATKVKTFTQLWDTLKEAAQSGWTQTWELLIGDFEEAKDLFTKISDYVGGFINKTSESRNNLLKGALTSKWDQFYEVINGFGVYTDDFQEKLKELAKTHNVNLDEMIKKEGSFEKALQSAFKSGKLDKSIIAETLKSLVGSITETTSATENMAEQMKKYSKVVNQVIRGDFGNGKARVEALTKAGYDYATIQNLVNEKLGVSYRLTSKLTEEQVKNADQLSKLSDAQLESKGYTDEQIEAIRELAKAAEESGTPIYELIDSLEKPSGRELIFDTLKNALQPLIKTMTAVRDAWVDIFPPMTSDQLYNIIDTIHEFSKYLVMSDDTVDKLTRTLRGLFAIIDIITTITGGALKIALKTVAKLLGMADIDILSVTATIGDMLVAFRDWIDSVLDFAKIFEKIIPCLQTAGKAIRKWFDQLKESDNIPRDIIAGLINGLQAGIKLVSKAAIELGKSILESIKNFLGIHSPSTKFIEVGEHIVSGLIKGLQNGIPGLWNFMKGLASKLVEMVSSINLGAIFESSFVEGLLNFVKGFVSKLASIISSIDFGALLAAGIGVGMLVVIKDLAKVLDKFAAPLDGLGDMLSSIGSMFEDIGSRFKAQAWEARSKAILNMAIAILLLATAVSLLAEINTGDLIKAGIALGVLAGVMVALAFAAKKMGEVGDMGKASLSALGATVSLLILAFAIKKLASIDMKNAPSVFTFLAAAILGLSAIMIVIGKFVDAGSAASINKAGGMLIKMSVALLMMTLVIKQASKLEGGAIAKGIGVITLLGLFFAGFVAISQFAGEHGKKAGSMLLKMSVALLIMIGVIKIAAKLEGEEIFKGLGVIAAVELLFIAVVAVSRFAGKNAMKAGAMLLMMSVALSIMISVVKQASKLEDDELDKSIGVIAKLELLFAAVIVASRFAGKNAMKAGAMLLMMSGALLAITVMMFIISKMDPSGLSRALGVVSVLEILFIGLIAVSSLAQDCKGTLITLVVALGILVTALGVLSLIDPKSLALATASLSAVIGTFALLIASTHLVKDSNGMYKTLISLLVVVGALTAVIVTLANLEVGSALSASASLSLLLISFATAMAIVSKAGSSSTSAVSALIAMGLVVAELAVILGLMSKFNVGASLETAASLSLLLISMSGVLVVLSYLGSMASAAYMGIGALAVLGLVVAELAVILGLMSKFNVNPSIEIAASLSLLLISMSGALILLGVVGMMGPAALIGIASLAALIAGIGGLIVAIGALVTEFPILETFLDTGIPILEKIGYALGSFFGNIVGGFMGNLTSGLPDIGTDLSAFMANIKPFIEGAKSVDASAMEGVRSLAQTILILTAADVLQGLTSWLTGGSSLAEFGAQLAPFGRSMAAFSTEVAGKVNADAVTAAANAGKILAEMASTIPNTGGVAAFFAGENSITAFASQLVPFGRAIAAFSSEVAGKIDEGAVTAAANAGKVMSEMASTIPNTGGVAAFFAGENDMATFGVQLVSFGKAIKDFSSEVAGNVNEDAITAAASAGKMMAEMASTIPNTGGVVSFFTGDNNMATFGSQLKSFGKAMKSYSKEVSGVDVEAISTSVKAAKSLSNLQNSLGKTGGLLSIFSGDNGLDTFGSNIKKFGKAMKSYSKEVSGISTSNLSAATTEFKKLANMAKGLSGVDFDGLSSFGKSLGKVGKTGVNEFIKAFTDSNKKVSEAGSKMVANLVKGVESKSKNVTSAFKKLPNDGVTAIRDKYQSFYNAGSYLVSGFAAGISDNAYKAAAKAKAMAKAAEKAAKEELDINSPSKVFRKIGMSVPEGFAMGIDKLSGMVSASSIAMGETAIDGLKTSISRIADVVDSDIDAQPTIRPVLDLSDVESGANIINSMFRMGTSIDVLANVGAINSMMNRRIQNGGNSDVVSAIEDLRKDIGNISGNTYNVNGITYDDGSNISDAVESLVRAAIRERRM